MHLNPNQLRGFFGLCRHWPGVSILEDSDGNGDKLVVHPDGRTWGLTLDGHLQKIPETHV